MDDRSDSHDLAVVGLACRLPGSWDAAGFWQQLLAGAEACVDLDYDGLRAEGVPEALLDDPRYVRRGFFLTAPTEFDADYFGLTPDEAAATDPGHRLLMECVDRAMADAGHQASTRTVALYAGAAPSDYGLLHVARNRRLHQRLGEFVLRTMNDPDFLAAGIAYRLGFQGSTATVAAACSTALVAVHLAGQALRLSECDVAVAGAVDLASICRQGYLAGAGGLLSPTGRVRSFDAAADGTVFSCGVGAVVLRRLSDAVDDGDHIYAVIKGSAVNNDGSARYNFTTPSWEGQAGVIHRALSAAGVAASSLGFVECHAPGTAIGDMVEFQALAAAFGQEGVLPGDRCLVGSAKPNVGHAGVAAGIVSLIKATLAVYHGLIPPTVNYRNPNPDLNLPGSPFFVNTEPVPWPLSGGPRRAGVSSFGAGGTNAHVVLEQPPRAPAPGAAAGPVLLPCSGRTEPAADEALARLHGALATGQIPPTDAARTLQTGRAHHRHRIALLAFDREPRPTEIARGSSDPRRKPRVAFIFSGGGGERIGMGKELLDAWPAYRDNFDRCLQVMEPELAAAVRQLTCLPPAAGEDCSHLLESVEVAHPALFAVEYALAELWRSWGIEPDVVAGHSLGEYAAACVAGVLDLADAVRAVTIRSRLLAGLPAGGMLAVLLDERSTAALLGESVCIAAVNSPGLTVVAGTPDSIDESVARCERARVAYRRLRATKAFHSRLVEPIMTAYREAIANLGQGPARVPVVSTVTGNWLGADEPMDAAYWVRHLRQHVRFSAAVDRLVTEIDFLLEIGPGESLSHLVGEVLATGEDSPQGRTAVAVPTMPRGEEQRGVLTALGQLWAGGIEPDWAGMWAGRPGRRVSLPAYPYQGESHIVEADPDLREYTLWGAASLAVEPGESG